MKTRPLKTLAFGIFMASISSAYSAPSLFATGVDDVLAKINNDLDTVKDSRTCIENFSQSNELLYHFDSNDLDLSKLTLEQMNRYIQAGFDTRLDIKESISGLKNETSEQVQCLSEIKDTVKALRYMEDYLIEYSYRKSGRMNEEFTTLAGEGPHFLKNQDFSFSDYNDLDTGDVLISRGNAFTSAAIARIGEDDYQFSHMTLVYRDQADQLHTSEAHIEIGSVVAPFQIHLNQKNARTVVFKAKDRELAKKAGEYTYNYVVEHKERNGYNIQYDFAMDYEDTYRLFCSEIVFIGYLNAAKELYGQELKLPLYKTKFSRGLIPFLRDVGINVNDDNINTFRTFGPGDLQFDPHFDIVAEWRNPQKMQDTRFKDAVLTKIFEWMEQENYRFKTSFGDRLKTAFGWLMRRNSWTAELMGLNEKFPLNMKMKQMNIFVNLDKVGEKLQAKLEQEQAKQEMPLTFKELYQILEDYRLQDLKVYEQYKKDKRANRRRGPIRRYSRVKVTKPDFHTTFRPKK